ncbi:MAG TPA: metallophosphoesterase [Armatimonadota bacterium]|nr:metallophosphoesterase [Armatimonadota bacterium]
MRHLTLFIAVLLISAGAWAAQTWQFTILHTNDLHGMMEPAPYFFQPKYARLDAGGLARRATAIAQLRKEIQNPMILIDCGDIFTRGPWHKKFYGEPEVAAMNMMGYDMMCVGNNEFKATDGPDSQDYMLRLMRLSQFPWLTANLTVAATGVPVEGIHPFIVRRYGNIRVGFLGLTSPKSIGIPQTKGWTITDPIEAAKQWVPQVRKECDILIAVTHIGVDLDQRLAATVSGIDAIVGGDSHTFIPTPLVVKNPSGIEVPIVQAGEQGIMLGQFDLTFENDGTGWHLRSYTGKLIPIDRHFADDLAIKQLLNQWLHPQAVGALPALPAA